MDVCSYSFGHGREGLAAACPYARPKEAHGSFALKAEVIAATTGEPLGAGSHSSIVFKRNPLESHEPTNTGDDPQALRAAGRSA
jgi:hypothetical protein